MSVSTSSPSGSPSSTCSLSSSSTLGSVTTSSSSSRSVMHFFSFVGFVTTISSSDEEVEIDGCRLWEEDFDAELRTDTCAFGFPCPNAAHFAEAVFAIVRTVFNTFDAFIEVVERAMSRTRSGELKRWGFLSILETCLIPLMLQDVCSLSVCQSQFFSLWFVLMMPHASRGLTDLYCSDTICGLVSIIRVYRYLTDIFSRGLGASYKPHVCTDH